MRRWIRGIPVCLCAVLLVPLALGQASKRQVGEMVMEDVPEWPEALRERMLQYLNVRSAGVTDIAPDGSALLINTRFGNVGQVHLVRMPMGARKQITFFDEPVGGGGFLPGKWNGRKVLFSKDRGGDERSQYYVLDLDSGKHRLLTDGKSRHSGSTVSHDGRWLAYSGTARNDKDFDVYLLDLPPVIEASDSAAAEAAAKSAGKMLWQVEGQYYPTEFSPDDSRLLIQHYVSERETHWFIHDVASGENKRLTPETPALYYGDAAWSADGKSVYLTSDRDGDFRKLYRVTSADGKWECLTTDVNWDVDAVAVEPTGKGIAFVVNEDGFSKLYFAGGDGKNRKPVPGLPLGVIGGMSFARKGGVMAITLNTSQTPSDAFTVGYPDGKLTRWTESEVGGLDTSKFVTPEVIRFPTFDQVDGKPRMIPAFYYKAPGKGPHAVIIYNHGGPESQQRPGFTSTFQYWLLELGISVIAPNVRGSTGYGRTFHQLDNGVKREDSIRDNGALLDWIARQPELDAKRVAVFGGSYGGYMVLGSLATYPERIKAGVDIVGIASFISFLEKTPEFRRDLRREEYGDERQPEVREVLARISPLQNAEKIKSALFVLHGKNDPRVPVNEAEQIVAKLRELKRPVWYACALNEGHGFRKRENSDLAAIMYTLFFERHLLGSAPGEQQ
ncbi:MAG: Dipeptidyl aminopeptidase BIII [Phycisphaerae bacterium]|nr:Dipeptidyl aminopeptidase BIII [Phycisphaerae bacterium]